MPCAPRMNGCHVKCLHRRLVSDYQMARQTDIEAAERAASDYKTELAEYRAQHPPMTFKRWLQGARQPAVARSGP